MRLARISGIIGRIACLLYLAIASIVQAATLPSGFSETRVATGLSSPTAMAVAPDGRIFIAQQGGALRVVKNGALLAQPFLTLSVDSNGERGLLGIAFDPDFASNAFIYLYYTTASSPHNRVSRFTASAANPDVVAAGSEVQLLNLPNLSSATNHNGGAMHFGTDGKLYIAVGENANGANAQSLGTPLGKILRINPDGSIPSDNPFLAQTTGINRSVWAMGLRNPFTFAIDRSNGRIHLNDVGQDSWEEVNLGVAGSNYGWPQAEGNSPPGVPGLRYPIYTYQNAGSSCAITGAAFYRPTSATFPAEYAGRYFFGDYCGGFIRYLSPPNYDTATGFASGISSLVDIQVHPDGSLYYLARGGGDLYRVQFTGGVAPSISVQPASATVSTGQVASFSVTASGTPPLHYQWQRNGVDIPGTDGPVFSIAPVLAENGTTFRVRVSNDVGSVTSNSATLTVLDNRIPTGTITAPGSGTLYRGGQSFTFSGSATDPEDGVLPPSAFTWRVDFHHDFHVHPFMQPTTGVTSGTFTIPDRGETSQNVFYRVVLIVRDSAGLTHTSTVDVRPRKTVVRIESNVANAQLTLDGTPITAPLTFTGVEGIIRSIGVVTPQTANGTPYEFASWSDGGAATHEIATPTDDTTFTALFQPSGNTVFSDNFESNLGWSLTPGENNASAGTWQRGDPDATSSNGVMLQPGSCAGGSASCLVTGLAAGTSAASNDVDGGQTSIQSPPIVLPSTGTLTLSLTYFLAHLGNATADDYFRARIVGSNGVAQTVIARGATASDFPGVWRTRTANISAWAGQTIRIRVDAIDRAGDSVVEAGVDNVVVTRQ